MKTWAFEPLTIATLAGQTPTSWESCFFDDRVEEVDFDIPCDLVTVTAETFTARRAYEIMDAFRARGRRVVAGGFHPTICPEEALEHADAVCIGEAEELWPRILSDAAAGKLRKRYRQESQVDPSLIRTDRRIYGEKRYFPFGLVESGRGCCYACEFCAVSVFFGNRFRRRPIEDIVQDVRNSGMKRIMFVDDNLCADFASAKALFRALIPLGIQWASQVSVDIVRDPELLDLMAESGCIGVLIGFESLNPQNLHQMRKRQNLGEADMSRIVTELQRRHIKIYASFVFGYDGDDEGSVEQTLEYALQSKFYLANFYQLTPFPGTALYERLRKTNRLRDERWWLSDDFSYGNVVFTPAQCNPERLASMCLDAKKRFFGYRSILKRAFGLNCDSPAAAILYFVLNLMTRKEIRRREGLTLGRARKTRRASQLPPDGSAAYNAHEM